MFFQFEVQVVMDFMGSRLIHMEETDSTNEEIKRLSAVLHHGSIVVADSQSMGKGRLGRNWSSPKDEGLWMSFILRPELSPEKCAGLTLVVALSLTAALREITGLDIKIKWPNDLVVNGCKLSGILTEMVTRDMEVDYIVAGVGVNLTTMDFPADIKDTATSLSKEGVIDIDKMKIVKVFSSYFEKYFEQYVKTGDFSLLREEYEKYLVNCGKEVRVIGSAEELRGIATGINSDGELLLDVGDKIITIRAGEVSVRGIYGYV